MAIVHIFTDIMELFLCNHEHEEHVTQLLKPRIQRNIGPVIRTTKGGPLVMKFSAFYGTQNYVTMFTIARHWTLSWARWIQLTPVSLTSIFSPAFERKNRLIKSPWLLCRHSHCNFCRLWGCCSGGYEEFWLLQCDTEQPVESQSAFRRNMPPPFSGSKS
jgi:hypothetical protein